MKAAYERCGVLADDIGAYVNAEAQRLSADTGAAQTMTLTLGIAAVVAGFADAMIMSVFGITRPLNRIIAAMDCMAQGEVEARLTEAQRRDEVGAVARAVEGIEAIVARKVVEDAQHGQDAAAASLQERRRMLIGLADAFEREVGGISGEIASASTLLQDAARAMSATATDSATQSTAVAVAAEQAAANVHTVAAAAEELGSSVQEIVRNVTQAATGTGEVTGNIGGVAEAAEGTGRTADQVLDAASGLSRQSDRLSAEVRRFVETIRAA